ncbi:MAG: hypothetical protein A2176_00860 [Spirochaetes bacterium RBG_13_51_14]|nr:MAG: hypothetical protein A2176_00860 [Spirochaetes bacterium RBG_13_51_14]
MGPFREAVLRERGFVSWDDCLTRDGEIPFNGKRRKAFLDEIRKSIQARDDRNIDYFTSTFPTAEHWRILGSYFGDATFIDVETTGLSWHYSHASVIAAYHRGALFTFVYGENIDDFLSLADEARLLVTFNGTCFDIPFLEKTFNIPSIGRPHVDLRWVAWHHGYRGGLKSIERRMGIRRPPSIDGIDGIEAVDLFFQWQRGDASSRDRLVSYCSADVLSTYLVAERLLHRSGCVISQSNPDDFFAARVS